MIIASTIKLSNLFSLLKGTPPIINCQMKKKWHIVCWSIHQSEGFTGRQQCRGVRVIAEIHEINMTTYLIIYCLFYFHAPEWLLFQFILECSSNTCYSFHTNFPHSIW